VFIEWLLKLRLCSGTVCGIEWYGYATLGILTAILSFLMDLTVTKLLRGRHRQNTLKNNKNIHIGKKKKKMVIHLCSHIACSSPVVVFKPGRQYSSAVPLLDSLPSMPLCFCIILLPQHLSLLYRSVHSHTENIQFLNETATQDEDLTFLNQFLKIFSFFVISRAILSCLYPYHIHYFLSADSITP